MPERFSISTARVALGLATLMLVGTALTVPAGAAPATRPEPSTPATAPRKPATAPPARKARPKAAPPARKARPKAAPPKKKKRVRATPRPATRPADERRRAATRPAPREVPPEDKEPVEKKMSKLAGWGWTMVGIAAALLTVTGVFALMVEDREDEMERLASFVDPYSTPPNQPYIYSGITKRDFETYQKEGRRFEIVAFTFLGLSAAATATAVTLFILDAVTRKKKAKKESAWKLQPTVGPKGAGLSLGLRF